MKIDKKVEGNTLIISLEGRLDSNTSADLENELSSMEDVQNLIFDFEKLEYISSAGLRILLALQKMMGDSRTMVIKNVNKDIKEVFEITGFLDFLTLE